MVKDDILTPGEISSLVQNSYQRIYKDLTRTPVLYDEQYKVGLKCENLQNSGSFKLRGALSKLSLLNPGQTAITASTGNHGLGIATAAKLFGINAKIFIPISASKQKIAKLQKLGADLQFVDGDSLLAELSGKDYAAIHQLPWVSPYNDPDIIAGQGTIGLELTEQLQDIKRVYITVGGGGLISGIAGWMKYFNPAIEIIGCHPKNSPEMYLSVKAGHVVQVPEPLPTLSDGSAGPLEKDSITFDICRKLIDRFVLIEESEIEHAIRHAYQSHLQVIEGAAGVALAAALKESDDQWQNAVVILCGGNIDPDLHARICQE